MCISCKIVLILIEFNIKLSFVKFILNNKGVYKLSFDYFLRVRKFFLMLGFDRFFYRWEV